MQDLKAFTSHAPFFQENFRGYALLQQRDKKKKEEDLICMKQEIHHKRGEKEFLGRQFRETPRTGGQPVPIGGVRHFKREFHSKE